MNPVDALADAAADIRDTYWFEEEKPFWLSLADLFESYQHRLSIHDLSLGSPTVHTVVKAATYFLESRQR